jgi:hypothetical protein
VPTHTTPSDQANPFRRALMRLVGYATYLYHDLASATAERPRAYLPKLARRNLPAAQRRITNALAWLIALSRTLAGDRYYLPQHPPRPAPKPATNPTPARPAKPRTEQDRAREQLTRMRHAFSTLPTGLIVQRIARHLGIAHTDTDDFPHALIGITATPQQFATVVSINKEEEEPGSAPPPAQGIALRTLPLKIPEPPD